MAHFAQIDENNVVVNVLVVPDEQTSRAQDFLNDLGMEGTWVQTSYNTVANIHLLGGTPMRKNFASVGFCYDPVHDAFYPPKPFPSWKLNENTFLWEPPTPQPQYGYAWDEQALAWYLPPQLNPS